MDSILIRLDKSRLDKIDLQVKNGKATKATQATKATEATEATKSHRSHKKPQKPQKPDWKAKKSLPSFRIS